MYFKRQAISGRDRNFTTFIHELMHINQIENGELGFDENGTPTMLGLDYEIEAYQMQFDFDAGAVGNPVVATEEYILDNYQGAGYENLPKTGGSCPVHV